MTEFAGKVGFIVGTGRCGTKFVREVAKRAPGVAVVHERNPLNETFHRYCKWYGVPVDHGGFLHAKETEIRADLLDNDYSLESSAFLSLSVVELATKFGARFVLLVRSPEAVVSSYLAKGWYKQPIRREDPTAPPSWQQSDEFHHFLGRIVPNGDEFERWSKLTRVGKLAWYWRAVNAAVMQQFAEIPADQSMVVKLEDMDFDKYLEVSEFLGFKAGIEKEEFEEIAAFRPNRLTPPYPLHLWSQQDFSELRSEVGELASQFGYDLANLAARPSSSPKPPPPLPAPVTKPSRRLRRVLYISQGNIPSRWAHTFQAMKMADAMKDHVGRLNMLVAGALRSTKDPVDLHKWYGVSSDLRITKLPVHKSLRNEYFTIVNNRRFERLAGFYAAVTRPSLVFTRSVVAAGVAARAGVPTVLEIHRFDATIYPEIAALQRHSAFVGIVTVTEFIKERYAENGIDPAKILVAADAVDLKQFDASPPKAEAHRQLGWNFEKPIVMYCGHLYAAKGVDTLLVAAESLPDVQFVIVGGWPEDVASMRRLAPLPNITFTGFVEHIDIPLHLAAADVLALPNSATDVHAWATSPLKLFEYMAAGRPVVATKIPAISELLIDNENAFLAPPDDPVALAKRIFDAINNAESAKKVADNALAQIQNYTWDARAQNILAWVENKARRSVI